MLSSRGVFQPGIEPALLMSPALAGRYFTSSSTREAPLLGCMCDSLSVLSDSLRPHRLQPTRLLCLLNSLGKNTGVGCHFLLHLLAQFNAIDYKKQNDCDNRYCWNSEMSQHLWPVPWGMLEQNLNGKKGKMDSQSQVQSRLAAQWVHSKNK